MISIKAQSIQNLRGNEDFQRKIIDLRTMKWQNGLRKLLVLEKRLEQEKILGLAQEQGFIQSDLNLEEFIQDLGTDQSNLLQTNSQDDFQKNFCWTLLKLILQKEKSKRNQQELDLLEKSLQKIIFFNKLKQNLERESLLEVFASLQYEFYNEFSSVCLFEEKSNKCYVILKGTALVLVPSQIEFPLLQNPSKFMRLYDLTENDIYVLSQKYQYHTIINQLKNGQSFGEIGVYYKTPRTATIIATKLGTHLVSLANKIAYNSLQKMFDSPSHKQKVNFLQNIPIYSSIPVQYLNVLLMLSEEVEYKHGNWIYHLGEQAQSVYIIQSGSIEIRKRCGELDLDFIREQLCRKEILELQKLQKGGDLSDLYEKDKTMRILESRGGKMYPVAILGFQGVFGEEQSEKLVWKRKECAICVSDSAKVLRLNRQMYLDLTLQYKLVNFCVKEKYERYSKVGERVENLQKSFGLFQKESAFSNRIQKVLQGGSNEDSLDETEKEFSLTGEDLKEFKRICARKKEWVDSKSDYYLSDFREKKKVRNFVKKNITTDVEKEKKNAFFLNYQIDEEKHKVGERSAEQFQKEIVEKLLKQKDPNSSYYLEPPFLKNDQLFQNSQKIKISNQDISSLFQKKNTQASERKIIKLIDLNKKNLNLNLNIKTDSATQSYKFSRDLESCQSERNTNNSKNICSLKNTNQQFLLTNSNLFSQNSNAPNNSINFKNLFNNKSNSLETETDDTSNQKLKRKNSKFILNWKKNVQFINQEFTAQTERLKKSYPDFFRTKTEKKYLRNSQTERKMEKLNSLPSEIKQEQIYQQQNNENFKNYTPDSKNQIKRPFTALIKRQKSENIKINQEDIIQIHENINLSLDQEFSPLEDQKTKKEKIKLMDRILQISGAAKNKREANLKQNVNPNYNAPKQKMKNFQLEQKPVFSLNQRIVYSEFKQKIGKRTNEFIVNLQQKPNAKSIQTESDLYQYDDFNFIVKKKLPSQNNSISNLKIKSQN